MEKKGKMQKVLVKYIMEMAKDKTYEYNGHIYTSKKMSISIMGQYCTEQIIEELVILSHQGNLNLDDIIANIKKKHSDLEND